MPAFVLAALTTACSGEDAAPSHLLDGSKAPTLPTVLQGIEGPAVLTAVRTVNVERIEPGSRAATCLQRQRNAAPSGPLVERMGVVSESVTFRERSTRLILGCDNSPGAREEDRRWCGGAAGRLYHGRLRDPRLNMGGCSTEDGDPTAFVWIEPSQRSRYVVVEQPEYAEVYEVAGGLPARVVTTTGVSIEGSSATFELSEHDQSGRLVRRYTLDARVAG